METTLHTYDTVVALPNRSVVKDSRNRLFQVRHFENGDRKFAMFGDHQYYNMDGTDAGGRTFVFPVTVLWVGQAIRLEGGYENIDGVWELPS